MKQKLRSPFVYSGGKQKVASLIWGRLGDCDNVIEPFCGSAAFLLARPHPPKVETLNDFNHHIANFWRSTKFAPEQVVEWCDWPISECDLHAIHVKLTCGEAAEDFRKRMYEDPDYFDPKFAGRWVYGINAWIGGNWCDDNGVPEGRPQLDGSAAGKISNGGIHGVPDKRPVISGKSGGAIERGTHQGLNCKGRPQLADAYSRGRGVHGNDSAGTCQQRRDWLLVWFKKLQDRLRTVRVCCGDFMRIMDSPSVTTRLGVCGLFCDPPYPLTKGDGTQSRSTGLYSSDKDKEGTDDIRDRLLTYCKDRGDNPKMRICVAAYDTDGYEILVNKFGWTCVYWKADGGMANRAKVENKNRYRERLYFSLHCKKKVSLLD